MAIGTVTKLLYVRGDAKRSDYKANRKLGKHVNIVTKFVTKTYARNQANR